MLADVAGSIRSDDRLQLKAAFCNPPQLWQRVLLTGSLLAIHPFMTPWVAIPPPCEIALCGGSSAILNEIFRRY
jgi:hypothetical protein